MRGFCTLLLFIFLVAPLAAEASGFSCILNLNNYLLEEVRSIGPFSSEDYPTVREQGLRCLNVAGIGLGTQAIDTSIYVPELGEDGSVLKEIRMPVRQLYIRCFKTNEDGEDDIITHDVFIETETTTVKKAETDVIRDCLEEAGIAIEFERIKH